MNTYNFEKKEMSAQIFCYGNKLLRKKTNAKHEIWAVKIAFLEYNIDLFIQ